MLNTTISGRPGRVCATNSKSANSVAGLTPRSIPNPKLIPSSHYGDESIVNKFQKFSGHSQTNAEEAENHMETDEYMSNIDKELKEAKATTAASMNSPQISISRGELSRTEHTSNSFMQPVYQAESGASHSKSKRYLKYQKNSAVFNRMFESEIDFIDYLEQYKPRNLASLSSSQLINYHRFIELKIRKALMPVYYNKF